MNHALSRLIKGEPTHTTFQRILPCRYFAVESRLKTLSSFIELDHAGKTAPQTSSMPYWQPEHSVAFVDVKFAHDIQARYQAAFKHCINDLKNWKHRTDEILTTLQATKSPRIAASTQQLAYYAYLDGMFLKTQCKGLYQLMRTAQKQAAQFQTSYIKTLSYTAEAAYI